MLIECAVRHRLGTLKLDASLVVSAPWTILFGPSGSGKSTILRCLAGLVRPDAGRIVLLGQTAFDREEKAWVPAHLRPVRWAGQKPTLFPRDTVAANIAAGLANSAELADALKCFSLSDLAAKRPHELSGGQRQLVSVARAAVGARGRVLLLDEPFAGLDADVRDRLIAALRQWLGDAPVISVTHDVGEAFLLGAEIVKIAEGRVLRQGPVADVLMDERERLQRVLG